MPSLFTTDVKAYKGRKLSPAPILSIILEVLQFVVPNRAFQLTDLFANIFGVLVFGVLIIVNGTMVYTLGTNGSFRGIPTIMLIAASFGLIQAFLPPSADQKCQLPGPHSIHADL